MKITGQSKSGVFDVVGRDQVLDVPHFESPDDAVVRHHLDHADLPVCRGNGSAADDSNIFDAVSSITPHHPYSGEDLENMAAILLPGFGCVM